MPSEKAYHEAGHVVAACVLGIHIRQVTLDGVWTRTRGTDQERRRQAIVAMAGAAAEQQAMKYTKDRSAELMKTVWAKDVENAKGYIASESIGLARRMAAWLVYNNFDAVEMVAKALETHGKLTGEEVAALLSQS